MNELAFKTATELARLVRARKISAVELTQIFLERLGKLGPRYNALAELTPDLAIEQARCADRVLRKGDHTGSPLLGIPYGAKDLLATKNIPTRWGAPPYRDQVFDYDATAITRLRDAGAVARGHLREDLADGGIADRQGHVRRDEFAVEVEGMGFHLGWNHNGMDYFACSIAFAQSFRKRSRPMSVRGWS